MNKNKNEIGGADTSDADTSDADTSDVAISGVSICDTIFGAVNRNKYLILSFFLPVLIHMAAFVAMGVSPFGNKSMMVIDNFHQYTPFLSEFRDMLQNGDSLLYSWNSGLGANFWARYGYYLASPLNFLSVLSPSESLPEFILLLTLARTGVAGAAFYTYLVKRRGRGGRRGESGQRGESVQHGESGQHGICGQLDKGGQPESCEKLETGESGQHDIYEQDGICGQLESCKKLEMSESGVQSKGRQHDKSGHGMFAVACAVMYAMSSFTLAYYWNIMWFDCIAILPLIVLGMERLVVGKSGILYSVALAVAMFSNYYIALIICMFLAVYFFVFYFSQPEKACFVRFIKSAARFAFYSVLACGAALVVLLPTIHALSVSQSVGARFPSSFEFHYGALELLSNHLINIKPSVMSGMPNIYCGVVVLILVPLYFFNKGIGKKEKICSGAMVAFMFFSFNVNYLNFIWHGLRFPNSLSYRFSFLYVFFILALSYRAAVNLDRARRGHLVKALLSAAALIFVVEAVNPNIEGYISVYPSIAFLIVYAALLRLPAKRFVSAAFALVIVAEITINALYGIGEAGIGHRDSYMDGLDSVKEAVAKAEGREDGFYRMEFLKDTVSNTPSLYNYKGVSYFSSTAVLKLTDLMGGLGMRPSSAWYIYKGSTPVINSMLSIRYLLSKEDTYNNPLYPQVDNINGIRVYENPYNLPLAFVVDDSIRGWSTSYENVFLIQNDFLKKASGVEEDVMKPLEINDASLENIDIVDMGNGRYRYNLINPSERGLAEFVIRNPDRRLAYLFIKSRQIDYVWYIKGDKSEGHDIKYYPYIIDTQYFDSGEDIDVSIRFDNDASGDFSMYAAYFDEGVFTEAYNKLSARPMEIESFRDDRISGIVDSGEEGGVLFTSVPFEKGWKVKVDGVQAPLEGIAEGAEGFISVNLAPGRHTVEFNYMPPGFVIGAVVSIVSVVILIVLAVIPKSENIYRLLRRIFAAKQGGGG